jgi:beta-xylosidase
VHFQDRGAYGRILHLQPMTWKNDWPVIGVDPDGDGKGEPVTSWKMPGAGLKYAISTPQTSDEFDTTVLGLQWQWHANHSDQWYSLTENKGALRLRVIAASDSGGNLWNIPNLLLQKFPFQKFTATAFLTFYPSCIGEKTGLLVMGLDYSYLAVSKRMDGYHLSQVICKDADKGMKETDETDLLIAGNSVFLRVAVDTGAVCRFSYSEDGKMFKPIGKEFTARKGQWIGAKVGIFAVKQSETACGGYADFDWFRIGN